MRPWRRPARNCRTSTRWPNRQWPRTADDDLLPSEIDRRLRGSRRRSGAPPASAGTRLRGRPSSTKIARAGSLEPAASSTCDVGSRRPGCGLAGGRIHDDRRAPCGARFSPTKIAPPAASRTTSEAVLHGALGCARGRPPAPSPARVDIEAVGADHGRRRRAAEVHQGRGHLAIRRARRRRSAGSGSTARRWSGPAAGRPAPG